MAASPMALFPFISTLVTVDLYRHLWAYQRADGAAGALAAVLEHGRQVARSIELIRYAD
jgi:hypothetical protein